MKQSESIAALAKALCAAQSEMGAAVKGKENTFFKATYADLGSVIKAIKEPFTNNELSYIQFPCSNDVGIGVTTRLMHSSGEWLESEFFLPIVKRDPQASGAAITYARRYSLQSVSGIPVSDSDGEAAMFRTAAEDLTEATKSINAATTIEDLASTFKMLWHSHPNSRAKLTDIKDSKKEELLNEHSTGE